MSQDAEQESERVCTTSDIQKELQRRYDVATNDCVRHAAGDISRAAGIYRDIRDDVLSDAREHGVVLRQVPWNDVLIDAFQRVVGRYQVGATVDSHSDSE